jgi:hypothetical protein
MVAPKRPGADSDPTTPAWRDMLGRQMEPCHETCRCEEPQVREAVGLKRLGHRLTTFLRGGGPISRPTQAIKDKQTWLDLFDHAEHADQVPDGWKSQHDEFTPNVVEFERPDGTPTIRCLCSTMVDVRSRQEVKEAFRSTLVSQDIEVWQSDGASA